MKVKHLKESLSMHLDRRDRAFYIRQRAAFLERERPQVQHPNNGDESAYPNKIGNYSKCLPHSDLGEVDTEAYAALLGALDSSNIADFESVPLGGTVRIASPLGGLVFSMEGPDSAAIGIPPPHPFGSRELAAEMVELYWMALLRDVPFNEYATSPLVSEAIKDLSRFPKWPGDFIFENLTPENLFLADYPNVLGGPRVSQFLLVDFAFDGVPIKQKLHFPLSVTKSEGIDLLTFYDEWLAVQRGFPDGTSPSEPRLDPQSRYIRNVGDLGWAVGESAVLSTYLKAALMLLGLGREALDENNPYRDTRVIGGLGTLDFSNLMTLLGQVVTARHFNFQKWHHRFLRPEAFGGRIHNHLQGLVTYPIDGSLLNSPVLERVYDSNGIVNERRGFGSGAGTYLLPCLFGDGSPTHPSYPAGHGVAAGAAGTLFKAWFKEDFVLPDSQTVKPNSDGTMLEPYQAGVDGPPLTIRGEINKLVHNMTWGRAMSGVHFRVDGIAGNVLGEELMLRILSETRIGYIEPFRGFTLSKFDGTQITV